MSRILIILSFFIILGGPTAAHANTKSCSHDLESTVVDIEAWLRNPYEVLAQLKRVSQKLIQFTRPGFTNNNHYRGDLSDTLGTLQELSQEGLHAVIAYTAHNQTPHHSATEFFRTLVDSANINPQGNPSQEIANLIALISTYLSENNIEISDQIPEFENELLSTVLPLWREMTNHARSFASTLKPNTSYSQIRSFLIQFAQSLTQSLDSDLRLQSYHSLIWVLLQRTNMLLAERDPQYLTVGIFSLAATLIKCGREIFEDRTLLFPEDISSSYLFLFSINWKDRYSTEAPTTHLRWNTVLNFNTLRVILLQNDASYFILPNPFQLEGHQIVTIINSDSLEPEIIRTGDGFLGHDGKLYQVSNITYNQDSPQDSLVHLNAFNSNSASPRVAVETMHISRWIPLIASRSDEATKLIQRALFNSASSTDLN